MTNDRVVIIETILSASLVRLQSAERGNWFDFADTGRKRIEMLATVTLEIQFAQTVQAAQLYNAKR